MNNITKDQERINYFRNKRKILSQLLHGKITITSKKIEDQTSCKAKENGEQTKSTFVITISASCFICNWEGLLRPFVEQEKEIVKIRMGILESCKKEYFICSTCEKIMQTLVKLEDQKNQILTKIEDIVAIIKAVRKRDAGFLEMADQDDVISHESEIVITKAEEDQDISDLDFTDSENEEVDANYVLIVDDVKDESLESIRESEEIIFTEESPQTPYEFSNPSEQLPLIPIGSVESFGETDILETDNSNRHPEPVQQITSQGKQKVRPTNLFRRVKQKPPKPNKISSNVCLTCNKPFSTNSKLNQHQTISNHISRKRRTVLRSDLVQDENGRWPCRICRIKFDIKNSLREHLARGSHVRIKSVSERRSYHCKICLMSFSTNGKLFLHRRGKRHVQTIKPGYQNEKLHKLIKSPTCSICKIIVPRRAREGHMNTWEHYVNIRCKTAQEKLTGNKLSCPNCDGSDVNTFLELGQLRQHFTDFHKYNQFRCILCNSTHANWPAYQTHRKDLKHLDKEIQHAIGGLHKLKNQRRFLNSELKQDEAGKWPCLKCDKIYSKRSGLRIHLKQSLHLKHLANKPGPSDKKKFHCRICEITCRSRLMLIRHQKGQTHYKNLVTMLVTREEMEESKRQICSLCDISVAKADFNHHLNSWEHYVNERCKESVEKKNDGSFPCPNCEDIIQPDLAELIKHFSNAHKPNPFECFLCKETHPNWNAFRRHKMREKHMRNERLANDADKEMNTTSNGNKLLQCKKCHKQFAQQISLEQHEDKMHKVREERGNVCDICGESFLTQAALKNHNKFMHGKVSERIECRADRQKAINKTRASAEKDFKCPLCPKVFTTRARFLVHDRRIHKKVGRLSSRKNCDICGMELLNKTEVLKHKAAVHGVKIVEPIISSGPKRREVCPVPSCRKEICNPFFRPHLEIQHFPGFEIEKGENIKCPYGCGWESINENDWISHVEACCKDKGETPTSCAKCNAGFPSYFLSLWHKLREHPENNITCQYCFRSITSNTALHRHYVSHPEAKPFPCPKCGEGFRAKWCLKVHLGSVCNDDEEAKKAFQAKRREKGRKYLEKEKPFKCSECGKGFASKIGMTNHQKSAHS